MHACFTLVLMFERTLLLNGHRNQVDESFMTSCLSFSLFVAKSLIFYSFFLHSVVSQSVFQWKLHFFGPPATLMESKRILPAQEASGRFYEVALYLSIITGSLGVSFRLPQLFLSQHRLHITSWVNNTRHISGFLS